MGSNTIGGVEQRQTLISQVFLPQETQLNARDTQKLPLQNSGPNNEKRQPQYLSMDNSVVDCNLINSITVQTWMKIPNSSEIINIYKQTETEQSCCEDFQCAHSKGKNEENRSQAEHC